jgi:hypothetical protein
VIVKPVPIVTVRDAAAVLPTESFTCTPKIAVPTTGVAPDNTPPLDKLNPTVVSALPPEVTVHV